MGFGKSAGYPGATGSEGEQTIPFRLGKGEVLAVLERTAPEKPDLMRIIYGLRSRRGFVAIAGKRGKTARPGFHQAGIGMVTSTSCWWRTYGGG